MFASMHHTHIQVSESKSVYTAYTQVLAESSDETFFNDSLAGLPYLTKMQAELDKLSEKAAGMLDNIGTEQKSASDTIDELKQDTYSATDWLFAFNALTPQSERVAIQLKHVKLLINSLATTIVGDVNTLLQRIPNNTTYQAARGKLTEWVEVTTLLTGNLAIVNTTDGIIAGNIRLLQGKAATKLAESKKTPQPGDGGCCIIC